MWIIHFPTPLFPLHLFASNLRYLTRLYDVALCLSLLYICFFGSLFKISLSNQTVLK